MENWGNLTPTVPKTLEPMAMDDDVKDTYPFAKLHYDPIRGLCSRPHPALAIWFNTRLPSNLRLTTRECVHSVTSGHFLSCNKDGRHTIRSAIAETPCCKLHGSMFYRTGNRNYC